MNAQSSVSSSSSIHNIPIPTATGTAHAQPMDPPEPPLTAPASTAAPGPGPGFTPATAQEEETRQERVVIADAMDRLIESCQNDLWPPPAAARLLGLHSRDRNVEEARFAYVDGRACMVAMCGWVPACVVVCQRGAHSTPAPILLPFT